MRASASLWLVFQSSRRFPPCCKDNHGGLSINATNDFFLGRGISHTHTHTHTCCGSSLRQVTSCFSCLVALVRVSVSDAVDVFWSRNGGRWSKAAAGLCGCGCLCTEIILGQERRWRVVGSAGWIVSYLSCMEYGDVPRSFIEFRSHTSRCRRPEHRRLETTRHPLLGGLAPRWCGARAFVEKGGAGRAIWSEWC